MNLRSNRCILMGIFALLTHTAHAQSDLIGKWIPHTFILKGEERPVDDKLKREILTFRKDQCYTSVFRTCDMPPGSKLTLRHEIATQKTTCVDQDGRAFQLKRFKKSGTYHVSGDKLILNTKTEGSADTVAFEMKDGDLWVTRDAEGVLRSTSSYTIRYKRK